MRFVFLLLSVFVLSGVAQAAAETPQAETTRIVTDPDNGTITFIIDDKAVAQINRDGFHVVENINYGGTLTDTGSAHVEKTIEAGGKDVE